jgi:hypothetical protein
VTGRYITTNINTIASDSSSRKYTLHAG